MNNPLTQFWSVVQSHIQRVLGHIFSSTMQPVLAFISLCSLSFFSSVLSIECNNTQYLWPLKEPRFCCNMCPPGHHLYHRSDVCKTKCAPCTGPRYRDTYNVELTCDFCGNCNRPNMEYESQCNGTHNAVCRCKTGYKCNTKDKPCEECVPLPSTTNPPVPSATTALNPGHLTTPWTPTKPLKDTVLFLVIIALLSAGIAFVVLTRITPFLRWIKSKHGYFFPKPHAPVPPCLWDEEVSKPVQEACGKCDQPLV